MSEVKALKVFAPDFFLGIDKPRSNYVKSKIESIDTDKITNPLNVYIKKFYLVNIRRNLYRARVVSEINPTTFNCFLIDCGEIEIVEKQNFYDMINDELINASAAAKLYKLVGIRPVQMHIREYGPHLQAELGEGNKWDRRTYKFIVRLFEENLNTVNVQYIHETFDKARVQVRLYHRNKCWNLTDLLVAEKYAMHYEENINPPPVQVEDTEDTQSVAGSLSNVSISRLLLDKEENNADIQKEGVEEKQSNNQNSFLTPVSTNQYTQLSSNTIKSLINTATAPSNQALSGTASQSYVADLERLVKRWYIIKKKQGNSYEYKYEKPIQPITSYQNDRYLANFIKLAMDHYKSRTLLNLQAYMIPSILRGINVLGIAPKDKGKSMGILMPVLQMVASKNLSRGTEFNPIAVIICSSWKNVKSMVESAKKLLKFKSEDDKSRKPKIVYCYAGVLEQNVMMKILNGCDILIITPPSLLRLLKNHSIFKFDCLQFLCFDDIEILISNHLDELKEILFYKQTAAVERGFEPQRIITATHWTSGVESFVKNAIGDKFSVIVNNPLEIAVFERLNQTIIDCEDVTNAFNQIKDYLTLTEAPLKRTVIFTTNDHKLMALYRFLMNNTDLDLRTMKGSMSSHELRTVQEEWKQFRGLVKMPIIIISDEVLGRNEVTITEAQSLFHLDISKSKFASRLNCLHDKFEKLTFFTDECGKNSDDRNCYSYMFLCPDTMELHDCNFLYKFLGRCNVNRPAWLREKAVDYVLKKEKSKGMNDVCPRIKSYGECKLPACDKRHLIRPDTDRPLLPNKGKIMFRVLHLDSPSHFYIRILEHKTIDNSKSDYISMYRTVKKKLASYLNNQHNVHCVNPRYIKPGLIACIKTFDMIERVLVLDDDKQFNRRRKAGHVFVKLIDHGDIKQIEESELLQLSQELIDIIPQAVEVYLVGVRPLDSDDSYPEEAIAFTKEFLKDTDLHALIIMCIGSTLWIDTVSTEVIMPMSKAVAYDHNLSLELINNQYAEKNSTHMQKLIRLCTGKVDIWKPIISENEQENTPIMRKFSYNNKKMVFEQLQVKSDDDDIPHKCKFSKVYSPKLLFINNEDKINLIHRMEAEISDLIQYIETMPVNLIKPGTLLLYPYEEYWLRGYVLCTKSEYLTILSLDWGFIEHHCREQYRFKRLPTEYQELPFQAIICSLHYCQHSKESYSPTVTDAIINFGTKLQNERISLNISCYTKAPLEKTKVMLPYLSSSSVNYELELFREMQLHSIEVMKPQEDYSMDLVLHEKLIQIKNILPDIDWIREVLPESTKPIGRVSRRISVPHLMSDFLLTRDQKNRIEIAEKIEDVIQERCQAFNRSGKVPAYVEDILHSLCISIHSVTNPEEFMSFIRSLKYLNDLTQTSLLELEPTEFSTKLNDKLFDIRYISSVIIGYHSAMSNLLRLLEIVVRQNKRDDVIVFVKVFFCLLGGSSYVIKDVLEDPYWCDIFGSTINVLGLQSKPDESFETLLIILVQLVSLYSSNEQPSPDNQSNKLASIFYQASSVLLNDSPIYGPGNPGHPWESSVSLILLIVGQRLYWPLIREKDLFYELFVRVLNHFERLRNWNVGLDESVELLGLLWRSRLHGTCGTQKMNDLADRIHDLCILDVRAKDSMGSLLAELRLENSRQNKLIENGGQNSKLGEDIYLPDEDADLWVNGVDGNFYKKQEKSYNRVFRDSVDIIRDQLESFNLPPYDENDKNDEDDDEINDFIESDNSDVPIDDFLRNDLNPADEDNIECFDRS